MKFITVDLFIYFSGKLLIYLIKVIDLTLHKTLRQ
jgi:hypothetical protein